jgi:hypothetical protein
VTRQPGGAPPHKQDDPGKPPEPSLQGEASTPVLRQPKAASGMRQRQDAEAVTSGWGLCELHQASAHVSPGAPMAVSVAL